MAGGQPAARLPQEKDRPFPCLVPRELEKGQRGGEEAWEGPHQAGSPCPRPSRAARWSTSSALAWGAVLQGKPAQEGDPGQRLAQQGRPSSPLLRDQQTKGSCSQPAQGLTTGGRRDGLCHPAEQGSRGQKLHASVVAQSCPTLRSPMDCSPPGSSVHRVFQARTLAWWPLPVPGDLPGPGTEPRSPASAVLARPLASPGKPHAHS